MNRKRCVLVLTIAAALAIPGLAQAGRDQIEQLADGTGLSVRQVRMLLGARTAYAEYPYTFARVNAKFKEAVGPVRYEELMAGRSITIERKLQLIADAARLRDDHAL